MTRTVCYIDKKGNHATCNLEGMSTAELIRVHGTDVINCKICSFYKRYKGIEQNHFFYTAWTGETINLICVVCGTRQEKFDVGKARHCEIGIVCPKCYPAYKKVRDALRDYWNKSLRVRLSEILI